MKNLIPICILALCLSGCGIIAKSAPETRYFTLAKVDFEVCKEGKERAEIYIAAVKSQAVLESRNIVISGEGGQIYPLKNAKWISLPSEMIYERILKSTENSCAFKVSFDKSGLSLQTTLISLQADRQNAKVALGFSLIKEGKILKSAIVSATKPLASNLEKEVVEGLNSALDEAVSEILNKIKDVK